jgi:hypothetical protein
MSKLGIWKITVLAFTLQISGAGVFRSMAQDADAAKEDARPKAEFSAAGEAKFSEFLTKASEAKRKHWVEQMKKEIEEITKVTNIDAEQIKQLETIANDAASLCREGWAKKLNEFWRKQYAGTPDESFVRIIDEVTSQLAQYVRNDFFGDYIRPKEHPAWLQGLKTVLSAQQLSAWERIQVGRKAAIEKEIGDFLKPFVAQNREIFFSRRMAQGTEIKQTLVLSKERAEQVDGLVNRVADETVKSWRKHAEKSLLDLEDTARRNMIKNRHYQFGFDDVDSDRHERMWKDGLTGLLSPEEELRMEKAREERKARRIRAYTHLIIAELDKKIALTASQRERLIKPVEKVVPSIDALFPGENNIYDSQIGLSEIFAIGAKVEEKEVKDILDPVQVQHWNEVCTQPQEDPGSRRMSFRRNRQTAAEGESPENLEPEDVERIISDFFRDQTAGERKRGLLAMIIKAEDAARIAMLNPDSLDRLQTAARGAAERSFAIWRENLETNIRDNLNDIAAENVQARLASIPEYRLEGGNMDADTTILDEALKTELNDQQQSAWKKEIEARNDYRAKAIGAHLLAQFDRRHLLTADQCEKLAPKLEQVLEDYDQDISRMFSYDSGAWHLQSFSQFMPFVGIPEKELKEILGKEQWESWSGSNECSNATNYWENVNRNHDQRVKGAGN